MVRMPGGMLARMRLRDLWHLRGQVIAAALVVACGIGTLIAERGVYDSLVEARASYYAEYRFADVFAHLVRAPESLARDVAAIPGVALVQTRVVMDVTLDVPGLAEPATGRLVSIPGARRPILNDLHVLSGRWVDPARDDEVVASLAFADANGLSVGSRLGAVLGGRWRELTIVGIALSPEYVYEVGKGMLFPDNRRFGVLWMAREAMAAALDMEGGFNDVALALARDADAVEVTARVDRLLERAGGLSAYARAEQLSHRFLDDELGEIRVSTTFIPTLFLGIAAFLLYVVLARLVAMQRAEIGLLKAFGYSDARVGLHYAWFAASTSLLGFAIGAPLGGWLGGLLVGVYERYFHFPELSFRASPSLLLFAASVSLVAAGVGALSAVRRAVRLPPAESMRPEPPARFRAGWLERAGLLRRFPASARMIARNLARRPVKAMLSVVGVAMAVGLMVVGRFTMDASNALMVAQFDTVQRDDATVYYAGPRAAAATHELTRLPGVLVAEPFRLLPVWVRSGHRAKRVELVGLPAEADLRRLFDARGRRIEPPPEGLLVGAKLAEILGVRPGDTVRIEALEGTRKRVDVPLVALVEESLGLGAYMEARALARLFDEDAQVSGAWLMLDERAAPGMWASLKRMPAVGGVSVRSATQRSVRDTLDRSFAIVTQVLTLFACVIVVGMVYNSVRIALSERGHELATLRVLGFTEREVTVILLGEQGLLTLLAVPLGLVIGFVLCALLVPVFDRELFRLPLVVGRWTFVYPAITAIVAALSSGLLVGRRIRRLDLIAVSKTRE